MGEGLGGRHSRFTIIFQVSCFGAPGLYNYILHCNEVISAFDCRRVKDGMPMELVYVCLFGFALCVPSAIAPNS